MANNDQNTITRGIVRFMRFIGVSNSSMIADQGKISPADSVNYGAYTTDELRHMDGLDPAVTGKKENPQRRVPHEEDIGTYLEHISDNTHSKIEEIKNLVCVAPEIKVAKRVIVSTIMSPQDLQTNRINITMSYEGLSEEIKNDITSLLNDHFNKEFHLPKKLSDWLTTAGFDEGARAILILPKHELDVQNAIADVLAGNEDLRIAREHILASEESLTIPDKKINPNDKERRFVSDVAIRDQKMLSDFLDTEIDSSLEAMDADKFFKSHGSFVDKATDSTEELKIDNSADLRNSLRNGTLKLLRQNGDGTVVVTRDLNKIKRGATRNSEVLAQLLKDAKAQFKGFDPDNGQQVNANVRTYSISETIKLGNEDLPIIIELPSDSVIPVCAPRDNKNHIGYFVLIDESGTPISGKNNYFKAASTDVTNRLAMQAAKGVYGNATLTSFNEMANSPDIVLRQMTDIFTVAVNKLLDSKLSRDGLTGMNINMHAAVGKAMFMNLLAKNRISMVFVPEPMMVYYCFDHRDDGTGKTILEDASQILALRTTLMVARLMAAVDNATMHRTIEVDLDEADTNPIQTIQMTLRQALSKYAPAFSTEVQTAAESLINRNITVKPKSMAGTTDNLSVSIEKSYGTAQAPDTDLLDKLNNWTGMLVGGLPASVLNQLGENEFSRSVATTNMYFANQIFEWQDCIKPTNKKFVSLYVSANSHLVNALRDILGKDKREEAKNKENIDANKSSDVKDEKIERQLRGIIESIDVDLPPPAMAVKKAHFEEIQSFADAVEKIVSIIYSDDICVDDELRGNMNAVRAAITSKILREFLPKLGCQAIADIPEPSAIDADYAKNIVLYLSNIKRRIKNLTDLVKGQLPNNSEVAGSGDMGAQPTETNPNESGNENPEESGSSTPPSFD